MLSVFKKIKKGYNLKIGYHFRQLFKNLKRYILLFVASVAIFDILILSDDFIPQQRRMKLLKFLTFTIENSVLFYKGGEFVSNVPWCHKPMYHKGDYEIIICIKGPIYIRVENDEYTLNDHGVLVLPPFKKFEGYKDSPPGIDFYWIHFFSQNKEKTIDTTATKVVQIIKERVPNIRSVMLPINFKLVDERYILVLVHQILSIRDDISFIDERDYLTSSLLIYLFKNFIGHYEHNSEITKINYIKEWIRANISDNLTVAEIAESVHLNSDYLTRLFKKCTGMTTLQYLNSLKIEVASLLLVRTEMPIKQVAFESYFNNSKVFARKFKSETGLSPSEYRRSYNRIHHNNPQVDPQIPIPKRIEDSINYIPENGDLLEENQ